MTARDLIVRILRMTAAIAFAFLSLGFFLGIFAIVFGSQQSVLSAFVMGFFTTGIVVIAAFIAGMKRSSEPPTEVFDAEDFSTPRPNNHEASAKAKRLYDQLGGGNVAVICSNGHEFSVKAMYSGAVRKCPSCGARTTIP